MAAPIELAARQGFKTEVFQDQDPAMSADQQPYSKVKDPRL